MTIDFERDVAPFVNAGWALHWLRPRTKEPIGKGWSEDPVASIGTLRRRYVDGNNLGVRLGEFSRVADGYLHVLDLDIRKVELASAAWDALKKLFPGVDFMTFPAVISGSGGESRHIYFVTDKPFRSKKLVRSDRSEMVFDKKLGRDVKKYDFEIELFGAPKQVAMPPSIHPDTGLPYRWEREFDFDGFESPFIPASAIEAAGAAVDADDGEEVNDQRLDLTIDQARDILADLPLDYWCEDRDGWRETGMALKHEFGEDGYDLWEEFSRQSAKFDEKNQRQVWKSFKGKAKRPIRMATLKAAANETRLLREFDDFDDFGDDDSDFDDLVDGPAATSTEVTQKDIDDFDSAPDKDGDALPWRSLLAVNKDGDGIVGNLHNVELIVCNDERLRGLIQLNEFTQETVQRTPPGVKAKRRPSQPKDVRQLAGRVWDVKDRLNGDLWSDDRDFAVRSIIEAPTSQGGYALKVTDRDLKAAIVLAANRNAFHPVREYLNGLSWDGTERVDRLWVDYVGAEDDVYHRTVARLMMVAAVTRIFEPGHKFDFATILEGLQGKRKSTLIQVLGRNWFGELDGEFSDQKTMIELMQGKWLMEIPELTGFSRADVRAIKAFISRQKDRARLAYARRAGEFPRQCIFIGSTNDREYLKDDTGGRRFWPVECRLGKDQEIDTERLELHVDQMWAEAVHIYRQMRRAKPHGTLPLYLADREARSIAARLQESRRVENPDDVLAGRIAEWLLSPIVNGSIDEDFTADGKPRYRTETCTAEIWVECLGKDLSAFKFQEQGSVNRAMAKIAGWGPAGSKRFDRYGKQRMFAKGGQDGVIARSALGDI